MQIIYESRGIGKTTTLIKLAAEAEKKGEISYIVCFSHTEAFRIKKQSEAMNLQIGFPLTFDEFLNKQYKCKNIFIDNLEKLLEYIAIADIKAITLLKEECLDA